MRAAPATDDIRVPDHLPFFASISWFDRDYRNLALLDMLRRYEAGWRHLGVLGDPSPEEWAFIKALVERFGSVIDVPA
jgi:hypothetical protein